MLESENILLTYLLIGLLIGCIVIFIYYKFALFSNHNNDDLALNDETSDDDD